jgi:hypothetical protein
MSPAKDFVLSKLGGKRKSSICNGNGNMEWENLYKNSLAR